MDSLNKRNVIIRNISYTYDNTQRLIKNSVESFKRFNEQNNAQKLKNLFAHEIKKYLWTGFFIFGVILAINVAIMTFYLADAGYNYNLMDNSYINAVLPSQDIGGVMDLDIVRIEEVKFSSLNLGDKVVIYDDFSLEVYWVESVVSIDDQTKNIVLTYDNVSTNTYHIEDIVGRYTEQANFLGTVYYASTFIRGYIFLAMSHILLLLAYWYVFLSSKEADTVTVLVSDYNKDQNILNTSVQKITLKETVPYSENVGVLSNSLLVKDIEKELEKEKAIEAANTIDPPEFTRSKGDIIEYITATTGLNNYKGKTFLKYFDKVITEELAKGEDIHIINFGKFTTVTMPAKSAVNPVTKKNIVVPEHKQARFRFYREVKSKVK